VVKLLGGRAASAVIGFLMLAFSSNANAQAIVDGATALATPAIAAVQAQSVQSVTAKAPATMATQAAWLYKGGWGLQALVDKFATNAQLDEQTNCLATAVYFEARGESVEGQLAVARVVMNRAASGRYPPDWCSVVKQPAQFSFVHRGTMPAPRYNSDAWRKAQGVTRVAMANVVPSLTNDVLWYHADYVDPSWGHRLSMAQKIGQHIFYR